MIVQASALRLPLADASVHCVVTSPPYWGLREYEGAHQAQAWPDGWRGQLGSEPTPTQYLAHMAAVFAEVRRVLRPDRTLWLNLGDSYATRPFYGGATMDPKWPQARVRGRQCGANRAPGIGIAEKNLIGMPWRLALALQADAWYLRSEIIWHKTTAMPESVRDRPTKAHEHVFLLTRAPTYYYDDIGTREAAAGTAHARGPGVNPKAVSASSAVRTPHNPASQTPGRIRAKQNASFSAAVTGLVSERRMRTVWSIPGEAYHGAHYACFPRELARRCIAAGTSERGVCPACGAPWVRVVERQRVGDWSRDQERKARGVASCRFTARVQGANLSANRNRARAGGADHDHTFLAPRAVGWRPSCDCAAGEPVPALILDPFGGSGTTAEVAYRMGRVGISVDVAYQELQRERLGLFAGARA